MFRLSWIVLIVVFAASAAWAQESRSVPYSTITAGQNSEIKEPVTRVVRDRAAWLSLWRRHVDGSARPAPAVDFSRHMVIAVFAGESEARKVTIASITREPGRLVVRFASGGERPLPDGPAPLASPFHMVWLTRSPLPVEFLRLKRFPVVVPRP